MIASGCTPEQDTPAPPEPEVPELDYCDDVRDWQPEWSAFEDAVLEQLNERRAAGAMCSLDQQFDPAPPLTMNPALRCAARVHALDMAEKDFFSNLDHDSVSFVERAEMAGYAGTPIEQNIGAAHSDPAQLVTAAMGSVDLCIHIMDPRADEVGVGFLEFEGASFPSYWVQVFGASK